MRFFGRTPAVLTDDKKIEELLTRGVAAVIPRELAAKKLRSGERLRVYLGIDPTGAKLHLGHSVPLRKLQAFAELGHEVIFVVGSFTAMIGDPSGRDALREPLSRAQVKANFKDYRRQAQKVLDFSKVTIRYNHEWLEKINFEKILELASKFTVQQMIKREMFDKRIQEGNPIALHEFLYPLMVGYDSVVLDVDCELGGSDQEFNVLAGRHLQQAYGKRDKFVLTTKLIEGTDGRKMSKTYNNAVYFDDTPSDMYGKLMSVRDELVPLYFETLTDVSLPHGHPKEVKAALAKEVVRMYHGTGAAEKAAAGFMTAQSAMELRVDRGATLRSIAGDLGLSMSELRRLVEQKAIDLNNKTLDSIDAPIGRGVLKVGKHRFYKITN